MRITNRAQNLYPLIGLIVGILLVIYFGRVYEFINYPPFSVHVWRQADSAAQFYNFYNSNAPFWEPSVFQLIGEEGKVISEIPILYWLAAQWSKVFGFQDGWLRGLHLIIFLSGVYYLYRIGVLLIQNRWLALIPALLFASSPLILFYAYSSLPNVPAIGFAIIGWYFYIKHRKKNQDIYYNNSSFYQATAWFLLATLLKPSEGLHFIAASATEILILLFYKRNSLKLLAKRWLIPQLLFFSVLICYLLYVRYYNDLYGNHANLQGILPIWNIPSDQLNYITHSLFVSYRRLFFEDTYWVILSVMFFTWLFNSKIKKDWFSITVILLLLGTVSYIILFYAAFDIHDYYALTICLPVIFVLIAWLRVYNSVLEKLKYSYLLTILALAFFAFSLSYLPRKLNPRYEKSFKEVPPLETIELGKLMTQKGIGSDKKVIIIPDISPNVGLYQLKRFGWTDYLISDPKAENLHYFRHNADYLITARPDVFENRKWLREKLDEPVLRHNGMAVYPIKRNPPDK